MDIRQLGERLAARQIEHRFDEPLHRLCSFRIGGPADLLIEPESEEQIAEVLRLAGQGGVRLTVLGKGSNVLFSDDGYRGAVLLLGRRFGRVDGAGEHTLRCESGLPLKALCEEALARGLSGLEWAYGIPGTVGGAVYMNAGAYGGEMKDVLLAARHLDRDGAPGELAGDAMELGYRHSAFMERDGVITGATLRLSPDDPEAIRARMTDFLRRRREKQPLDYPSAGSTFRRPPGNYASALIDRCGLKGLRVGGAMVSEKHAGFVINYDNASAADVRALIAEVQRRVREQTGYELECEVKFID